MNSLSERFLEPYKLIWQHRRLLKDSVANNLNVRVAGSVLGLAWLVVGPVLLLVLYGLIYSVVFNIRPAGFSQSEYLLYIFSGLVPFIAFSQALAAGTASLTTDQALLLNKTFPAELIPMREVLTSGSMIVVGLAIVMALKLLLLSPSWLWLLLPVVLLLMIMAITGMVWAFALANLVMKDTQQIIIYILMMLLVASPIAYRPEMLSGSLKFLIYFNPIAYYVTSVQTILVLGQLPPWPIMIGAVVIAFVFFHGMYSVFKTSKLIIADLL